MNKMDSAATTLPAVRTRRQAERARELHDATAVGFRCPECGTEADLAPLYGEEIVSVYCLRHKDGASGSTRPVRMVRQTAAAR
ncbi:MAG TPA: hypothetical protein VEP50_10245 [bacterium]|nr:hypothetical protein [bacterium]